MVPDRVRWTDSRLDDKFETLTAELRAMRDLPVAIARMTIQIENCFAAVSEVRDTLEEQNRHRQEQEEQQRRERKSDRHWIIGSAFTAAGLVISAVAILAGHL